MKALGLVVSEKKIFLSFSHDAPRARLATFIKERIIHWSTQHMKALGHMVSEKKILLCFSHDAPRGEARMDPRGTVGRIYKEEHYKI